MPAANSKLGITSVLYLNTGTYASPTLSALQNVSECSMETQWDKGEASSRLSRVKLSRATMAEWKVTAKVRASNVNDANYTTIYQAGLVPDTIQNIVCLNGNSTTTGVWGFMFDSEVTKVGESLGLNDVVFDDLEFTPAATGNAPQYAVVTAGAPVYTAV